MNGSCNGPCMCGDLYCGRCFPGRAAIETAEEKAMGEFANAGLSPEEYDLAVKVGIEAVKQARAYAKLRIEQEKYAEKERKLFEQEG